MDKTRERVLARFYWPGVKRDVERHCQGCPECQRVAPRTTARNPLIPMPIIDTPFDCIALDIVGPLPKTSRGHRYILVLVDYATRYPEALSLRAATAKAVARELMFLFSRVGIAKEVLTDQGLCFMSRVMKEVLRLLQVKQLRTSVYHPQTDGLVERFNKTLKRMLKKAMHMVEELGPAASSRAVRSTGGVHRILPLRAAVWTEAPRYPGHHEGGLGEPAVPPLQTTWSR